MARDGSDAARRRRRRLQSAAGQPANLHRVGTDAHERPEPAGVRRECFESPGDERQHGYGFLPNWNWDARPDFKSLAVLQEISAHCR